MSVIIHIQHMDEWKYRSISGDPKYAKIRILKVYTFTQFQIGCAPSLMDSIR